MAKFKKKQVGLATLGERLQKIRQETGVSLHEIARATKVKAKYLEMIESDRFDQLPSSVYVKGFLRSYARCLKIEERDVINLYERERGIWENLEKRKKREESSALEEKEGQGHSKSRKLFRLPLLVVTPKSVAALFFLITVGLGGAYFWQEVQRFSQTPELVITKPADNFSTVGDAIEVEGQTEKNSQITINGKIVRVDEEGKFVEKVELKEGMNELVVTAVNRFDKKVEKSVQILAERPALANQEGEESDQEGVDGMKTAVLGAQDQQEKVFLTVKAVDSSVWISVEADGERRFSGKIEPELEQTFEAQEVFFLTSTGANKTLVKFDGEEDFRPLSDDAEIVRDMVFRRQEEPALGGGSGL
jgi:cytoskeletal protein RodZ